MRLLALALALVAVTAGEAGAEDIAAWPSRPIRMIVPTAAGGSSDVVGRVLAEGLTPILGQPIVVENVAGAASIAGTNLVAKAAPDGYTMMITAPTPIVLVPQFRSDVPYNPTTDLVAVGQVAASPHVLITSNAMPATVPAFVDLLKASPGKYNFGSNGIGSVLHLEMELFMLRTGTKMTHVPYKSDGEAALAILGGNVQAAVVTLPTVIGHVKAGTLRALAVTTPARISELPDVPAVNETVPTFGGITSWQGIFMPAKTDPQIVAKLNKAMARYLTSDAGKEQMHKLGTNAVSTTPEQFAAAVKGEMATWADVIKGAGIKPE